MPKSDTTAGREANAAQPLGERIGRVSKAQTKRTGKTSQREAGPYGPDSGAVGKTCKAK
jgi:hypothetical protein